MINSTVLNSIRKSWSKDTCYPGCIDLWLESKPEIGQCAITALLLHELYGGEILFNQSKNHYRNKINNKEIDLTKNQFADNITIKADTTKAKEELLNSPGSIKANTKNRYLLFKKSFENNLKKFNTMI